MIRITWNNLIPPSFSTLDTVKHLIKPAIFDNPEIGKHIRNTTRFYNNNHTAFDEILLKHKGTRSKFLSQSAKSTDVKSNAERMMHLLLLKTTSSDNIPYTLYTYPIRQEFRKIWIDILTPICEMNPETIKNNKSINAQQNRRILTPQEIADFKAYINLFFENPDEASMQAMANRIKTSYGKNPVSRDFTPITDVTFTYEDSNGKKTTHSLAKLLKSIEPCSKSSPYYADNQLLSEEDNLFFERISTLSVIASVWYLWEKATTKNKKRKEEFYQNQLHQLITMIFSFKKNDVQTNFSNDATSIKSDDNHTETKAAEEKLYEVLACISKHQYREAGTSCEEILLKYPNIPSALKGHTLARLAECCENGYPKPSYYLSIDHIQQEANNYNCIYVSKKKTNIKASTNPSTEPHKGHYIMNCPKETDISRWITLTAPQTWTYELTNIPHLRIRPNIHQKILLINDNFETNLQDAINILDRIRKSLTNLETSICDWENSEIYIRGEELVITPILDTALSFFSEDYNLKSLNIFSLIRIFLIDEAKRSADFLFAQYPNFYHLYLTQQSKEKTTNTENKNEASNTNNPSSEQQTIHVVLVSNNTNHSYSKWIIKESFWTLPRYYNDNSHTKIQTKISVLSPYATELYHSIISECPGLASFSNVDGKRIIDPDPLIKINDISFPSIEYRNISFNNCSLQMKLKEIFSTSDFLYFVVDSFSDLESINLGTQIREYNIRTAVASKKINNFYKNNAIIAVRSFNPDYSDLARDLIIPKEQERSNQWFNDYNLITFGSMKDLFSWDQLSGGIIEQLAQCIHLQYCDSKFNKNDCNKNLESYFRRLYNRDSSFSAAVSIPYRLYESATFPKNWYISNKDAWWSKNVRNYLANEFEQKLKNDNNLVDKLAHFEHMRWCCYQLTRGWLPATAEQVIQYMSSGVSKHTLQIAKLHPCICSWEALENLQKALSDKAESTVPYYEYYGIGISESEKERYLHKKFKKYYSNAKEKNYTYFQKIDTLNIEQTASIVRMDWDISNDHTVSS